MPQFYVTMELCPNGDLYDLVKKSKGLSETLARSIYTQIVDGVQYMHEQGHAHRDLKLENIVISEDNIPKIADMGLQKNFTNNPLKT